MRPTLEHGSRIGQPDVEEHTPQLLPAQLAVLGLGDPAATHALRRCIKGFRIGRTKGAGSGAEPGRGPGDSQGHP